MIMNKMSNQRSTRKRDKQILLWGVGDIDGHVVVQEHNGLDLQRGGLLAHLPTLCNPYVRSRDCETGPERLMSLTTM